jgi:hypothetical protein
MCSDSWMSSLTALSRCSPFTTPYETTIILKVTHNFEFYISLKWSILCGHPLYVIWKLMV